MPNDKNIHDIGDLLGAGVDALFGERKGIAEIELSRLRPNPYQPRKTFQQDEIEDLAASILERGLLQPIRVAEVPDEPGFYYIIVGERRYRAHERLKLPTIKAFITNWSEESGRVDALVENLQRSNLSPLEEAQGIATLIGEYGLTHEEAAKKLGKSRVTVTKLLGFLDLPERIREESSRANISRALLFELTQLEDEKEQLALWEQVTTGQITSRDQVREVVAKKALSPARKPSENETTLHKLSQAILRFERLTDEGAKLDDKRLSQYEELYNRFSAALEKAQTKIKRGKGK